LDSGAPIVLAGAYHVMPTDLDVYKAERWFDYALFPPEARDAYRRLVEPGWADALRALHPGERIYTFWGHSRNAFARNAGLRIDHLLLSPPVAAGETYLRYAPNPNPSPKGSDGPRAASRSTNRSCETSATKILPAFEDDGSIRMTTAVRRPSDEEGDRTYIAGPTIPDHGRVASFVEGTYPGGGINPMPTTPRTGDIRRHSTPIRSR
jgi:hypothetical protein